MTVIAPPPPGTKDIDAYIQEQLATVATRLKYNPDQPRDEGGRWTDSGGGGSAAPRELTARERAAVMYYAHAGFYGMNHLLRYGDLGLEATARGDRLDQVETAIEQMDSAIAAQPPSTEERVLYRGSNYLAGLTPGTVFQDKGFISTSKDLPESLHFAVRVMEIHVPPGVKMLDVGDMKSFNEHEVILPRGSKFRVDSVGTYRPPLGTFDYTLMKVSLQP